MKKGVIYAVLAYGTWGLLPLYWSLLDGWKSEEILAYRIVWSFIFLLFVVMYQKNLQSAKRTLTQSHAFFYLLLSSLLISTNWFTYIWAVTHNHVLETSLGYYINPLISILLGTVFLKEKLNKLQIGSIFLAAIGVSIFIFHFGAIPWVAVILAASFAFYGLVKKVQKVTETTGLAIEMLLVLPLALIYLVFFTQKTVSEGISLLNFILLSLTGLFTALPYLWFAMGARRIPLSMVGFLQYIEPTLTLFLGIFFFNESFTLIHGISFFFIWSGLFLYSISFTRWGRRVSNEQ